MPTSSRSLPDIPNKPNKTNWVEQSGGLPKYIERIAKHLRAKGMPTSRAIAVAVNAVKRMCASGDTNFPGAQQVNAKSRAQACAAVASWERKKAQAKARRALKEGAADELEELPSDEELAPLVQEAASRLVLVRGLQATMVDRKAPRSAIRRATAQALALQEGATSFSRNDQDGQFARAREALEEMEAICEALVALERPPVEGPREPAAPKPKVAKGKQARLLRAREGEPSDDVKNLQERLVSLGYDVGAVGADGSFGKATRAAVRRFQRDHGLRIDGVVGRHTHRVLNAVQEARAGRALQWRDRFGRWIDMPDVASTSALRKAIPNQTAARQMTDAQVRRDAVLQMPEVSGVVDPSEPLDSDLEKAADGTAALVERAAGKVAADFVRDAIRGRGKRGLQKADDAREALELLRWARDEVSPPGDHAASSGSGVTLVRDPEQKAALQALEGLEEGVRERLQVLVAQASGGREAVDRVREKQRQIREERARLSESARSRAGQLVKLQWRDRFGRWIDMPDKAGAPLVVRHMDDVDRAAYAAGVLAGKLPDSGNAAETLRRAAREVAGTARTDPKARLRALDMVQQARQLIVGPDAEGARPGPRVPGKAEPRRDALEALEGLEELLRSVGRAKRQREHLSPEVDRFEAERKAAQDEWRKLKPGDEIQDGYRVKVVVRHEPDTQGLPTLVLRDKKTGDERTGARGARGERPQVAGVAERRSSGAASPGGRTTPGNVGKPLQQVANGKTASMSRRRKQDLVWRGLAKWDGPGEISLTAKGKDMLQRLREAALASMVRAAEETALREAATGAEFARARAREKVAWKRVEEFGPEVLQEAWGLSLLRGPMFNAAVMRNRLGRFIDIPGSGGPDKLPRAERAQQKRAKVDAKLARAASTPEGVERARARDEFGGAVAGLYGKASPGTSAPRARGRGRMPDHLAGIQRPTGLLGRPLDYLPDDVIVKTHNDLRGKSGKRIDAARIELESIARKRGLDLDAPGSGSASPAVGGHRLRKLGSGGYRVERDGASVGTVKHVPRNRRGGVLKPWVAIAEDGRELGGFSSQRKATYALLAAPAKSELGRVFQAGRAAQREREEILAKARPDEVVEPSMTDDQYQAALRGEETRLRDHRLEGEAYREALGAALKQARQDAARRAPGDVAEQRKAVERVRAQFGASRGADSPVDYPATAGWLDADPDHRRAYEYLLAREDKAGGSGGAGNEFVDSLLKQLRSRGDLTPAQLAAALRGADQDAERAANAAPVVTGNAVKVTGKVLSSRSQMGRYGPEYKMLVEDDRGFRVWSTVPKALGDVEPGDRVELTGAVKASDRDPTFGFVSRPRAAKRVPEGAASPPASASTKGSPIRSLAQFRKRAEAAFKRANPDAKDAELEWTHSASVKWADGSPGFSGVVQVKAPGYRSRSMVATYSGGALTVR